MKTNNIILALFILIFFSACYKKIDNTSLNEDYKILDQVTIIGTYKNITYGNGEDCPNISKVWLNQLVNISKFNEIIKDKSTIELIDLGKPAKRLIIVKPISYENPYRFGCLPSSILTDIFVYDIEDISKTWSLKSYEDIMQEVDLLENKNLIYTNRFMSDIDFNTIKVRDDDSISYLFSKTKNRDVRKFFIKVFEDLEKVFKFPSNSEIKE